MSNSGKSTVQDVMRDNFSPEAIAVIAAHLHGIVETGNEQVDGDVAWFKAQLLDLLRDEYRATGWLALRLEVQTGQGAQR